jgi:hypothetical protein
MKTLKGLLEFFVATAICLMVTVAMSMYVAAPPVMVFGALFALSIVFTFDASHKQSVLFNPLLYRQVWLKQIMEGFWSNAGHLMRSKNMDEFVVANTINLAEAGVYPEVLVNNNVYPIPFAERADSPLQLPLDHYVTEGTVVRNPETAHLSYNKLESVIGGHRNAMLEYHVMRATYNWTPAADGAFTPVLQATGANRGDGKKALKFADLANAEEKLNLLKVPQTGRILVLCPQHKRDLQNESAALFNAFANLKTGEILNLCGFDIYWTQAVPKFHKTNGTKKAWGAEADSNDTHASMFYHEGEVMRCNGEIKINEEPRQVTEGGVIVNVEKWFSGLPIRNKYAGAIFSPDAV